jgi:hypothetical protein
MNSKDKLGIFIQRMKKNWNRGHSYRRGTVRGSSFDWDKFANALKDEFGENLVEEECGEEDPYNWWLTDVTVTDIVDFIKNYR